HGHQLAGGGVPGRAQAETGTDPPFDRRVRQDRRRVPEMTLSARPLRLATTASGFDAALAGRLHWSADTDAGIEQAVADILADVRKRGDAAVLEYTNRFDMQASAMADLQLKPAELKSAFDSLPSRQRSALEAAAQRVRSYHIAQRKASGESWSYRDEDGTLLGQKVTPLDRVGIY